MSKRIVLVGAGEVGFYLGKKLAETGHDITIIDINPAKVERASQHLDAMVIQGHGAQTSILLQAGTAEADLFLAVTRTDEVNLIASYKARKMNPRAKILARVRSSDYLKEDSLLKPEDLGIDQVINPERIAASEIQHLIENALALEAIPYGGGKIYMVALAPTENCEIMNKSLREIGILYQDLAFRTVAIERNGETIIPYGQDRFQPGDKIFVVCRKEKLAEMYSICGYDKKETITDVMIVGAGELGRLVAEGLKDKFNIRLVDKDSRKLEKASEVLPDTLLLQGDGTDVDFLEGEGIHEYDAFLALTNDQTTNLFAGLLAKKKGVRKVIVHISTPDYIPLVHGLGITTAVSKNLSTVDAFMRYVLEGTVYSVTMLEGIDTEVIELEPGENSSVIGKPLRDINFPREAVIGAVIHAESGDVEIATGKTVLHPHDRVLVFVRAAKAQDVEKLFK